MLAQETVRPQRRLAGCSASAWSAGTRLPASCASTRHVQSLVLGLAGVVARVLFWHLVTVAGYCRRPSSGG